jgi:uncharacterized lipoprotein YbaY
MKTTSIACVLLFLGLFFGSGCAYMDVSPVGDGDRVMTGKVTYEPANAVPDGAILSIRIVDNSNLATGPVLLGQQRIPISGPPPFEFRAEYRAEDALLRRGVNVEAKVLVNGKLRYTNLMAHVVTLYRSTDAQQIMLQATAP